MNRLLHRWKHLGIAEKFYFVFALLLALLLLIASTGYLSSFNIRRAEQKIRKSNNIFQHVLEMDRGMERAYRLHGDFFLQYQYIGLQKAHELYAQTSIREIAQVIKLSNELNHQLFTAKEITISDIHKTDVNLYLASAKRFAETSIASFELLTLRATPDRGIEPKLTDVFTSLSSELKEYPALQARLATAFSLYKDYQIHRQRFLMQSSQNEMSELISAIQHNTSLQPSQHDNIIKQLEAFSELSRELLAIDLDIAGNLHDFYLQRQAVAPVSSTLITLTKEQAKEAEQHIDTVHAVSNAIILLSTLLAILILIYISRLIHNAVTSKILQLTEAATAFSKGKLEIRVPEESGDELGRLAQIFNTMAVRLKDLIDNLETKVALRTEELALSEERFRQLVGELPNIAVQGFDQERRVIYWNKASEELFGYSSEEAVGKMVDELIIPADMQKEFCESLKMLHESHISLPVSEQVLIHKSSSKVPVYAAYVLQVDSLGKKTVYGVHVDLAELKTSQARELRSETFYRQLFEQSSSGVVVYEPIANGDNFIIRDFNHAAEVIEKISRDEVIGRTVTDIFPGIINTGLLDVYRLVLQTGEPMIQPATFYQDSRIAGWRENRIYRLPSGEIVTIYNDVTRQKLADEEKQAMELSLQRAQKMEAIGLMAGGIAHDLNNTLSAIVGYPELLLLQLPPESTLRKPISAIKDAGDRAAAVVADLLTVARGVASTRQSANLNALVQDYFSSPEHIEIQTQYPHIQFEQYLAANLHNMNCSPIHVKKCIMNLINNGVESMGGIGTLTLATRSVIPDQEQITSLTLQPIQHSVLRISDNGPGIPEKDLPHIFEPFYTKRAMGKTGGTGLGLSVVWNTMKDHSGAVTVTSSNKGTIFDLYFPAAAEEAILKTDCVNSLDLQGNGETILVIDDEPQQCHLAREMLKHYGYRVECQVSGEKAVDYLHEHQVDLIILDMIMAPGMNGRQTYTEITKMYPGQKAIIATGFSESNEVKATLDLGADSFIKKPYSMKELAVTVKSALQK